MPDSHLLQTPRHKFFAFSAVGVAMVCLPLVQVLRYQHDDLRQLDAERKMLDPVSQAVHAQFGILAHKQVSFDLLGGQPELESSRAAVQAGVDQQLQALAAELTQGMWIHALTEARDLRQDWMALTRQVSALALTPQASNEAHTLRVEQMLQVMDLLSLPGDSTSLSAAPQDPGTTLSRTGLLTGTRLVLRLARDLSDPAGQASSALSPADRLQRLQPRLLALQQAFLLAPGAAAAPDNGHALAEPLVQVNRTAHQLLVTLNARPAAEGSNPAAQQATHSTALSQARDAQQALIDQAIKLHGQVLTQQRSGIEQQRAGLLALLAALAAAAWALARAALRPVPKAPPNPPTPGRAGAKAQTTTTASSPSRPQAEAHRVLDRLRARRHAPGPDPAQARRQPSDTESPPV